MKTSGRESFSDIDSESFDIDTLTKQASVLLTITSSVGSLSQHVSAFFVAVDLMATCAHGFSEILTQFTKLQRDGHPGFSIDPQNGIVHSKYGPIMVDGYTPNSSSELLIIYRRNVIGNGKNDDFYYTEDKYRAITIEFLFSNIDINNTKLIVPIHHFYDISDSDAIPPADLEFFVYYDLQQDCAIIQLPARDAQWSIPPLRIATGWKRDDPLWMCGFPKGMAKNKKIVPGWVDEEYTEGSAEATTSNNSITPGHFLFRSAPSLDNTVLEGLSGGAIVTADGYCIGIQVARMPTKSDTGSSFNSLEVTPAYCIQRMMEHRLHLEYRRPFYAKALSNLHEHSSQNRSIIKSMIIAHQSDVRLGYKLRSYLLAISRAAPELRFEFFSDLSNSMGIQRRAFENDCLNADLIIIALSQKGQAIHDKIFLDALSLALNAHRDRGTLLFRFDINKGHHWQQNIIHASFDMSEPRALLDYIDDDAQSQALARIALRIRRFLDRDVLNAE